jgi:hypothetical protein
MNLLWENPATVQGEIIPVLANSKFPRGVDGYAGTAA